MRIKLIINIIIVEIKPKHRYLITLLGNLYEDGNRLCDPADDFLRTSGLFEEYEPDVSREETGESSSSEV